MSVRQMAKFVVLCAVASACFAPIGRLADIGVMSWWVAAVMGGIAVPIAVAVASFVVVRPGPFRDRLIRALLAVSTAIAFGEAAYYLVYLLRLRSRGRVYGFGHLGDLLAVGLTALVLGVCLVALLWKLVPGRRRAAADRPGLEPWPS
jgi:hypothetical protein